MAFIIYLLMTWGVITAPDQVNDQIIQTHQKQLIEAGAIIDDDVEIQ